MLLTGGSTGGHVVPALAVADTLRRRCGSSQADIVFTYLGSSRGVERDLAGRAGIPFFAVRTGKLRRAPSRVGLLRPENLVDLLNVPVGVGEALLHIQRLKPHVVLSMGGFGAVPTVLAAAILRVPTVVHEQTVQVGLANRLCAPMASAIALSFPQATQHLPRFLRGRAIVTGNPLRPQVLEGDPARAVHRFGFEVDDIVQTIYVTGGSQGARQINQAVQEVLPELVASCRLIHQSGAGPDFERLSVFRQQLRQDLRRRYYLSPFLREEISDAYALADLVVGRSGAGTVSELCAAGLPAVYVPLIPTGGDEQRRNAQMAADAGAAILLPPAELTGKRLRREVLGLLRNSARLRAMSAAARGLAPQGAADAVADLVLRAAENRLS